MPTAQARVPYSGRVTARELMPSIVKLAFSRHKRSFFEELRQEVDRCKYRNELSMLKNELVAHLPAERDFVGFRGKYIPIQSLFTEMIRLYDARRAFRTLPTYVAKSVMYPAFDIFNLKSIIFQFCISFICLVA